jgi:hypothetical protein
MKMKIVPIFQKAANGFVLAHHRHHTPVVGSIFQIGCKVGEKLVGVAICGRPVAPKTDYKTIIEVNRLCTDGTDNACSKLYAACARIAKEMGYVKIQTFILSKESGTSLKASGWFLEQKNASPKKWNSSGHRIRANTVTDLFGIKTKYPDEPTDRWAKLLNSEQNPERSVATDDAQ